MNELRWNLDSDHYSLMIMSENVILFSHYPKPDGIRMSIKEFQEGKLHNEISNIFGEDTLNDMLRFIYSSNSNSVIRGYFY